MDKFQRSLIKVQNTAYPLIKRYRHLTFLHGKALSLANANTHDLPILSTRQSNLQSSSRFHLYSQRLTVWRVRVCVCVRAPQSNRVRRSLMESFGNIIPQCSTLYGERCRLSTPRRAQKVCVHWPFFLLFFSPVSFPHTVGPPLDDRT